MLHQLIVLLISFGSIYAQNYFAPNIFYSDVYASSTQSDSKPDYAVDADFFEEVPTCFSSDASQPDVEGFHWILIDFGIVIANIKEIRMVIEPDELLNTSLQYPIEAYVVRRVDVPKSELKSSITPKTSLPWSSAYFSLCNGSETSSTPSQAITLQCPETYYGRWLAIRRKTQLNICLVNVYIERAFDECFEAQTSSTGRWFLGTVFRYVRHTPHETCRSSCMQASECEAVVFTKQRFSGICQLITGIRIQNSDQPDKLSDGNDLLNCPTENCIIEINYCHGGTSRKLEGRTEEMNDTTRIASSPSTALHEEEWFVKKSKIVTPSEQSMEPVYVLSVVFDGLLECEVWDCGPLYVAVTDANKTEQFCGTINTADVVKLKNAILFCNSTEPIFEPTSVRLRWYGQNVDPSQNSPQLQLRITGGRIRVSRNKPIPMTTTSTTTPVVITTRSSSAAHIRPTVPAVWTTPASDWKQFTEYRDNQADEFEQIIPSGPAETDLEDQSFWSEPDSKESNGWIKAGEKQTYEFNFPLNDQQSQMREQQQQQQQQNDLLDSEYQPTETGPVFSTSIPDRVYEKRNILVQSNSPSFMSRSPTGNAIFAQPGVGLWTSSIVTVYLAWLYL